MNFQGCVKFANEHRDHCYIATAEGNQPHVRAFGLWFADDKGFYFQTISVKAVCKQLTNNNNVELCFYSPSADIGPMMRVAGKVEFLNDLTLKNKVWVDRPFLKEMGIKGPEDPKLVIFRVSSGEAYIWTMAYSGKEAEIERVRF